MKIFHYSPHVAKNTEFNRVPNSDVAKNTEFNRVPNSDVAKNTEFNRFRTQMWLKTQNLTGSELR